MKIFVFTDEQGNVIGSYQAEHSPDPGAPSFKPAGRSKGRVYEVEMPDALAAVKDPAHLHQELSKLIPQR